MWCFIVLSGIADSLEMSYRRSLSGQLERKWGRLCKHSQALVIGLCLDPGVVTHAFNPGPQEVEARKSL